MMTVTTRKPTYEPVFETLNSSNARLISQQQINRHYRLALWSNTQDHVSYHADNIHTLSLYLQGGEGSRRTDRNHGCGRTGSLCLMPQYHHSSWEITSTFRFAHLYFTDDSLKQFASTTLDIEPRLVQMPDLTFHEDPALSSLVGELFLSVDTTILSQEQKILRIFEHLLSSSVYCLNYGIKLTQGLSPRALRMIKEYIHQYYGQNISISTLAELVSLSEFHLMRMFKISTGFTLNNYVHHVRIQAVMTGIEQGHALSVLASQCGFSSQSHMNRLFKKWKGVTPGQYQRLVNS